MKPTKINHPPAVSAERLPPGVGLAAHEIADLRALADRTGDDTSRTLHALLDAFERLLRGMKRRIDDRLKELRNLAAAARSAS